MINSLHFSLAFQNSQNEIYFILRSLNEIEEFNKKNIAKQQEKEGREKFIERLKQKKLIPEDSIYMGDVEAFALGKTDKSKTLQEAGFS